MSKVLIDKSELVKFETIAKISNFYLKKAGITLSFLGYKDFIKKYLTVKEDDIESIYELTKESITWGNYLSEVENLINAYFLNKIIERDNSSSREIEKEIKFIRLFQKHLEIQSRHCNSIHSEMIKLYKRNAFRVAFRSSN